MSVMRGDVNPIVLRAAKAILGAARPLELDIAGSHVACDVRRLEQPGWPGEEVDGVDEMRDGPWPAPVELDCRWDGGKATLRLSVEPWDVSSAYRGQFGLRVSVRPGSRSLIWSTVSAVIGDTEDGTTVVIPGWFALVKRRNPQVEPLQRALNELVAVAKLPLLSTSKVELFRLELPAGTVLPSPEAAFRHLVHLALLKLDFMDRGERAAGRGKPLVDLRRYLPPNSEPPPLEDIEDDEGGSGEAADRMAPGITVPLDLILYGPPGTGKTFQLLSERRSGRNLVAIEAVGARRIGSKVGGGETPAECRPVRFHRAVSLRQPFMLEALDLFDKP